MVQYPVKYPTLPPLVGFIVGILISEWCGNQWLIILTITPIIGIASIFLPSLRFLLLIPIGILFSASPNLPGNHIRNFTGEEIDIVGTLSNSPRTRIQGSSLFIDVEEVISRGARRGSSGRVIINTDQRIFGALSGREVRILNVRLKPFVRFNNPGAFDIKRYYEREGIYARGFVKDIDNILFFGGKGSNNAVFNIVDLLRFKFGNFVRSSVSSPENEIINALTIGDMGGIPPRLRNDFSAAGIAHILSISGLHVGAIALVFYFTIKWLLKRSEYLLLRFQVPRLSAAITLIPVFVYTAIAGLGTPVLRAFIMLAVYSTSIVMGRGENKLNTLAFSAFLILIWQPWALYQLSFQLSFGAVLGIILVDRVYTLSFKTFKDKLISSTIVTLATTLFTLPFIINSFGVLSLVSIPANLVAVPFVEFLVVPLGLLTFLTFWFSEAISLLLLRIVSLLTELLVYGTERIVEIPYSYLTLPSINVAGWIFYSLAVLILLMKRAYPRIMFLLPVAVLGLVASLTFGFIYKSKTGLLEVNYLDAAGRDLVFLRLPQEKAVLIDGGYSYFNNKGFIERGVVTPFLLNSDITRIDYLILTTLDKDHIEGAKYLLRNFHVDRFWTNGGRLDGEIWKIIKTKKIRWKNISERVENFNVEGVTIEFFKPRGHFKVEDSSKPYPLILRLTYGSMVLLLGESLGNRSVQGELAELYKDRIKSSVLFVPGIGGDSHGFNDFISFVSPKVVVTNGRYRHHHNIDNNNEFASFQTNHDGMVTLLSDGDKLTVKSYYSNGEYVF